MIELCPLAGSSVVESSGRFLELSALSLELPTLWQVVMLATIYQKFDLELVPTRQRLF